MKRASQKAVATGKEKVSLETLEVEIWRSNIEQIGGFLSPYTQNGE